MTLPVEDLIVQQLLEFDPTFDVGGGVATTGLMIEPLAVILQPIINEISGIQRNQSILTILESSDPDGYPEDIVDGLASNVHISRKSGEISTTTQRLRFFEAQDFSAARGIHVWRGPGSQRFVNSQAISITEAEMSLNIEGGLVYVDIPIVATNTGSGFNVDAGSITRMEAEPVGVANTVNLFDVEDGRNRETNTELIERIKVAVTVRALVTGRGIIVTLTENFTTIVEIQPVGFGDPEMMRDIVYNVHIGGNVDVYVRTASLTDTESDVASLEVDGTRQVASSTVLSLFVQDTAYDLLRRSIDRTNVSPVVQSIDGAITYSEGVDYTIDDLLGEITRIAGSSIFNTSGVAANTALDSGGAIKRLFKVGSFASVKAGMILNVLLPSTVAGRYTVRSKISSDEIEVYGTFGAVEVGTVSYSIDDSLVVSFEHNPVSIDFIKEARSSARGPFTILNVPMMKVAQVAVLDPISGEPTGELLDGAGGFGTGGFGVGGFGVGSGADYRLVVTEPTLRFSQKEDNFLNFDLAFLGYSVRVSFTYASAIAALQAFVEDEQNRTMAADLLVRHFNPVFVETLTPIKYQVRASDVETSITNDEMTALVSDFVNEVTSTGALEASDLVDLLYDNGAARVSLNTVLSMRGILHHHNGQTEYVLMDDEGVMAVDDSVIPDPTDKPSSPRIARFIASTIELERTVI